MAQKQKATGIITLSALSIKICCPLFCLLFKKYLLSIRNRVCAQALFIALKLRQTNSTILFVFLLLKCQVCLTFFMKITKMADFTQTWQISHSDVISILCCTF